MTLRRSIPWVILAVGLFAALDIVFSTSVSAAGVISANCTGLNCQLCNLFALADTLIKYAIYVAVPIGGAVFAYAGFLFITSGGSTENASKARTLFFDVILGFIFVLIAFLVVDTIIQTLANGTFTGANWRGVSCTSDRYLGGGFASAPINPITPVTVTPTPGGSTSGITVQGSTMTAAQAQQALTSRGIAVAASVNLEGINSDVIDKIIATSNDMGRPLTITSARDGVHANTCHAAGTCLDVVCTSCGSSASGVQSFINASEQQGYCAVYEPGPSGGCPVGVTPCRPGVGSGAHYSFYKSSGAKDALCQ
jgi:hypothetical protein